MQGILTIQSRANQLEAVANKLNSEKVDDIEYNKDTNTLTAYADGVEVDRVELEGSEECGCEDGVPVVDFTVVEPDEPDKNIVDNVVEF